MATQSYVVYQSTPSRVTELSKTLNFRKILHTHSTSYGVHKIVLEDIECIQEVIDLILEYDPSGLVPQQKAR